VNRFLGIGLAVFGVALAVVPFVSDCASHGFFMTNAMGMQMPMRCYGNRVAELATGAPLFAVGAVLTFTRIKSKMALFSFSLIAVLAGVLGILMPTKIIGTCRNPMEICNTVMKPSLISVGALTIVGGLTGIMMTLRSKGK